MGMNKTNYTNYQEYFKSFLGGWSFENGDETLTIKEVSEEEMYDSQTQGKKKGLCLWFEEKDLPMVLNVTNSDTIAQVVGSDKLEDWVGHAIVVGQSEIKAFGKPQTVIRVRNVKPSKSVKNRVTEGERLILEQLIENGKISSLEAMLKHYKVSKLEDLSSEQAQEIIRLKGGE